MVIETKKLNFNDIKAWSNIDGFPAISFLSVYAAAGLIDAIQKYVDENPGTGVVAVQQIFCNFYTFQKIRNLIKDSWERYNIKLSGDNKVEWISGKSHDRLNYARTLNKKITVAITYDAANYACGVDDTLEDDVIIFTDGKDEEIHEDSGTEEELQVN